MQSIIREGIKTLYQGAKLQRSDTILALRKQGVLLNLLALDLPSEYGGLGLSCTDMAEIFAFCGELDLDLRDLPGLGHARILFCAEHVGQEQVAMALRVAKGESFFGVAITEEYPYSIHDTNFPSTGGSDLHSMHTVASPTEGGFSLSGKKSYVARLSQADVIVVFAKLMNNSPASNLGAFLVPLSTANLSISEFNAMGLRGVSLGEIEFHNVFVSKAMQIGSDGFGMKLFNRHFEYWRTAMAAAAIGCARGSIRQALQWLVSREAFGGPIGRFTHLQQELSKHVANLRMAWLLVLSTMKRIDNGEDAFVHAALTKSEAVEIALSAADWSMKIHGALGYTENLDLEKRVRDLFGLRVADGSTDLLRSQVARGLLGDDMYELSLGRTKSNLNTHPLILDELFE